MALSEYKNKRKITIDHTVIDSTMTDYPAMVKFYEDSSVSAWTSSTYAVGDVVTNDGGYFKCLTASTTKEPRVTADWQDDWQWLGDEFDFSKVQSDGKDIRFTASDESTLLDYERELYERELLETVNLPEGLSFDGINDYVSVSNDSSLQFGTGSFTLECKFSVKYFSSRNTLISKRYKTGEVGAPQFDLRINDTGKIELSTYYNGFSIITSTTSIVSNQTYVVSVVRNSNGSHEIYIDGNLDVNQNLTVRNVTNNQPLYIGDDNRDFQTGNQLNGFISDVRIWNTARTQTQIQNNINLSLSGTETGLVAYYKFDEGTGTTLMDSAGTNDGTINGATWVDETTTQPCQAVLHTRIPSVSSSADTEYYMYYNNPDETVYGENKIGVWDSNFLMVQHMGDSLVDSTGNGNNGTNYGSTVVDGLNGKARSFDGVDDYISVPDSESLDLGTNQFSLHSLMYNNSFSSFQDVIIKQIRSTPYTGYVFRGLNTGKWIMEVNDTFIHSVIDTLTDIPTNSYSNIVSTRNISNGKIYYNGIIDNTTSTLQNGSVDTNEPLLIGRSVFQGTIDEVRISNIARSDAWIKADDYNLRAWELQSIGAEEDISTATGNPIWFAFNF